jgi:hypothetical protein
MRPSAPILALCAALSLVACDEPDDTSDNDAPDSGALDMGGDQSVAPDMMADDMAPDQADAPDMDAPDIAPDMMTVEGCDEAGAPFGGGDGSAAAPFLICTPAQLSAIREMNTPASYKLASDIALGQFAWTPIPRMSGDLDGGGHTIFNLRYNTTDPSRPFTGGLIDVMFGAIHDLTMDGLEVSGRGEVAGLVYSVGAGDGTAALRNIRVKRATIVATHADSSQVSAAGVIGSIDGVLEDIDFAGTIEATGLDPLLTRHSAMIVSVLRGQARRLKADGTMTLGVVKEAGGLVGQLGLDATLSDSSVTLILTTSGPNNGGLVGQMQPGSRLERCEATVTMTGQGNSSIGLGGAVGIALNAVVSQMDKRAVISRVMVEGQVDATSAGGLVGHLAGGVLSDARFVGQVSSYANLGAGCMVADLLGFGRDRFGQVSHVVASCAATVQGSSAAYNAGGVTGGSGVLDPANVSELRWDSDQTPSSGFRNTDPSVRGVSDAMLRGADEYSGWSRDAWIFAPGELPVVQLNPPMQ